jgi:hypothetical protein
LVLSYVSDETSTVQLREKKGLKYSSIKGKKRLKYTNNSSHVGFDVRKEHITSILFIKQNLTKGLFKLSILTCKLSTSPTILANQLSISSH